MKTQGFEARFSQNLAPVSREKPQNPYLAYISPLFSMQPTEAQLRQLYQLISIKSENYARVGSLWEGRSAMTFSTPNDLVSVNDF